MEQTKTDFAALLGSAIAFCVAVWGVIFSPVTVDSVRPIRSAGTAEGKEGNVADARLWDDPFAVFQDNSGYEYQSLCPSKDGPILVIIVPVSTRTYAEDREARLRLRFAVQHALLDQDYEPAQGWLLFNLAIHTGKGETNPTGNSTEYVVSTQGQKTAKDPPTTPAERPVSAACSKDQNACTPHIPIQFFQTRRVTQNAKSSTTGRYPFVAVVWLPDEVFCDAKSKRDILVQIDRGLSEQFFNENPTAARNRQYVVLGPWNSDEISYVRNLTIPKELAYRTPWIVSYRATIADAMPEGFKENFLSDKAPDTVPVRNQIQPSEADVGTIPLFRLPNRDDVLCEALLNEIENRGVLPGQNTVLNVWVFSEWDTLYGRGLAETFRALTATTEDARSAATQHYWDLHESLIKEDPALGNLTNRLKLPVKITVVPYLRGLDGTSTLYPDHYRLSAAKDDAKDQSDKEKQHELESAQGATQFDYIRRLTASLLRWRVPFLQGPSQPDAIVIFGSDTYDKLTLVKFLRQELKTCTYLTTDLDALYWDPHYLEYTRDLIVASAFPLGMRPSACSLCNPGDVFDATTNTVVQMRDSYQSAAYLAVSRLVHTIDHTPDATFFAFPQKGVTYRIGNTEPEPLYTDESRSINPVSNNEGDSNQSGEPKSPIDLVLKPIAEGESPFWSLAAQITVIILGLIAVWFDIPNRTTFPVKAADELWKWAAGFAPETLGDNSTGRSVDKILRARRQSIRRKWKLLPSISWCYCRKPRLPNSAFEKTSPLVKFGRCPFGLAADSPEKRTADILSHSKLQLLHARTKKDLIEICLYLLADLFSLREFAVNPAGLTGKNIVLPPDILPFADYAFSEFRWLPYPRDAKPGTTWRSRASGWIVDFFRTKLPSVGFLVSTAISIMMLIFICSRPVPFMVGPETRTYWMRVLRWGVESGALIVTVFVFYRVCFEQHRFRRLIVQLAKLIPKTTGLSNRQLLILIARSGELIGNLSIIPCSLVFLLFIAHVRPLGGVAMGTEELCLLAWGILMLFYSFAKLRSAALAARSEIRETYQRDTITAARLMARLRSFVTDQRPIQDDLGSLRSDIRSFVLQNSTIGRGEEAKNDYQRLFRSERRERLYRYFESCIERNRRILDDIGNYKEGVLAPLIASPIFNALLIPVGGAGGISLASWIVTLLR